MTPAASRNSGSPEKREFAGGALANAYASLSRSQFGSTTLSGGDLNAVIPSVISVGQLTGPLPHKSSTMGTDKTLTSWRKSGVLPLSSRTSQSTFQS